MGTRGGQGSLSSTLLFCSLPAGVCPARASSYSAAWRYKQSYAVNFVACTRKAQCSETPVIQRPVWSSAQTTLHHTTASASFLHVLLRIAKLTRAFEALSFVSAFGYVTSSRETLSPHSGRIRSITKVCELAPNPKLFDRRPFTSNLQNCPIHRGPRHAREKNMSSRITDPPNRAPNAMNPPRATWAALSARPTSSTQGIERSAPLQEGPKSANLTRFLWENSTFSGFKSRCMTLREWQYAIAAATCPGIQAASPM